MTLLPELALGFLALFAAYLLGARHQRNEWRGEGE